MKSEHFNIDDLIANEEFISWVLDKNNSSKGNWDSLMLKDDDISMQIKDAREIVIRMNKAKEYPTASQKKNMLANINAGIEASETAKVRSLPWLNFMKVAAVLLLCVSAYFIFTSNQQNSFQTSYDERKELNLPDGSSVVLNSNSTIKYSDTWSDTSDREVWLKGEAYFKVKKVATENGRKFTVHTEDLDVVVLGTQFNVNTHEDKTAVVLEEGKIDVRLTEETIAQSNQKFEMTPGQKTSFNHSISAYQISEVNTQVYTSWVSGTIVFDGTTLSELKTMIENNYGYEIVFEKESLLFKKIDGKIGNPDLNTLLNSLETIFNLDIKTDTRNKKIRITE